MRPKFKQEFLASGESERELYLRCLTKQQLIIIIISVAVGLLLILTTVTAVMLTHTSKSMFDFTAL